jgi:glycosyltransferase involved in cell wall biosynthesis
MPLPLASVLMPVYNGERFLKEALDSVFHQTFQDFELIIIDDGSTDNTAEIIRQYDNDKIIYQRNPQNSGIVATLNNGLALVKGKYIIRMDADDIALPQRFQLLVNYMEAHPKTGVCGASLQRFSNTSNITEQMGSDAAYTAAKLMFDTTINHPSAIIRTSVLKEHGLKYVFDFPHAEDYALWYEISKYACLANLPDVLLRYRMHGNNLSMQHNKLQYQSMSRLRNLMLHNFFVKAAAIKDIGDFTAIEKEFAELQALETVNINDIRKMDKLLMHILEINNKTGIYNSTALTKYAAWFWYVIFLYEKCKAYNRKMIFSFLWNKNSICKYVDKDKRRNFFIKSLTGWKEGGIHLAEIKHKIMRKKIK